MLVDICLPVHNEELVLEKNTLRLYDFCREQNFPFDWRIVIVVNGSTDQSDRIATDLSHRYPAITVHITSLPGRGNALKTVWEKTDADIVSYMDADLAVDLPFFPPLLLPIINNEADITIGCRFHPKSEVTRTFTREVTSRGFNFLAKKILNQPYLDLQCGFKAMRRDVFNNLLPSLYDSHWFFDTELVSRAHRKGYTIKEIPVNWQEERFQSRVTKVKLLKDSFSFLRNLLKLRTILSQESKNKQI